MSQFADLGLATPLLAALAEKGYTQPTPIQIKAIPAALAGKDLLAAAQTGTGKTAAFALPILQQLMQSSGSLQRGRAPRALILTPTRELAAQVEASFVTYGASSGLRSAVVFGGVGFGGQATALRNGIDVLVATPGRLLDHLSQRTVSLQQVEILVLDEADRMLDMGFLPSIRRVMAALSPRKRQTMLFSATFASEIRALAKQFLREPEEIQVTPQNTAAPSVEHRMQNVSANAKRDALIELLRVDTRQQSLIFTRTKHGANRLAEQLAKVGFKSAAIHGNKSQGARTRALEEFKSGVVTHLVATDIAARGLDIKELPVVYQYDLPHVAEDYVHRSGRTGRAGLTGLSVALVAPEDRSLLRAIEKLTGQKFTSIGEYQGEVTEDRVPARSEHRGHPGARNGANRAAPRPGQRAGQRPTHRAGQRPASARPPQARPNT